MTPIQFGTDGWRARIAGEYTEHNVARVAAAAARVFTVHGSRGFQPRSGAGQDARPPVVHVGYDGRFRSEAFGDVAARALAAGGCRVSLATRVTPTPALSWSVVAARADWGISLTASHNPGMYHGLKIRQRTGAAATPELTAEIERTLTLDPSPFQGEGEGTISRRDFISGYLNALRAHADLRAIRRRAGLKAGPYVVSDPLYAAGVGILPALLGRHCEEIHGDRDPLFGGLVPEPISPNLAGLQAEVKRRRASIGLAFDGDGDRLGAVDERGRVVTAQEVLAVLALHLRRVRRESGAIVKTVSCTVLLDRIAEREGLPLHETPIGFKHIAAKMEAGQVLIGGEESGGYGIPRHLPERDGAYSGLVLLEAVAAARAPLSHLVRRLQAEFGPWAYRRVDVHLEGPLTPALSPEGRGGSFEDRVQAGLAKALPALGFRVARWNRVDGVKAIGDDGWLLVRPSGTEPVVRVYAEARRPAAVSRLLATGKQIVYRTAGGQEAAPTDDKPRNVTRESVRSTRESRA